uniref:Scythe/bat3 n=1 Tax=Rhizophora mucronata TaxID=61149 RepID=A0A2P2LMV2_RHIMU
MADQHSNEGSSTSNVFGGSSDSTIEINIKTLESRIYSFRVDRNMPVAVFKEKIADETGVPVGQQRLIFRGKVLKDEHLLSEYQLENGHTLHLVVRQPAQSQTSTDASSGDTNATNGNQASGAPRNRIGQISHSVVLGTFNVGDHGEAAVPDLDRVIGAVLNTLGIGGQAAPSDISGVQSSTLPNIIGQASQGSESRGSQGNGGGQVPAGTQSQSGQTFLNLPFQLPSQVVQMPVAPAIPVPSLPSPIPDSLSTLSEFMTRMEQTLVQHGNQPSTSSTGTGELPRVELPFDARGLRTPEALSIVLRQAEQLLSSHTRTTLSHMAGCLEQDGTSVDINVRGQIQSESVQVGLAMQHLGALFLELGRTILTLRMGQSPAESSVNPGPAVYISPSGPNPIMVQPFPLQANSLFGGTTPFSNPVSFGPVGVPNAPRHINIHIHAGTSLAPVLSSSGSREIYAEGTQRGHRNGTGSGPVRVVPTRTVIATPAPSNSVGVAVSNAAQSGGGVSISQPLFDSSLSSMVSEINSHMRNLTGNMQGENQPASGSAGAGEGNDTGNERSNDMVAKGAGESSTSLTEFTSETNDQKPLDGLAGARDNEANQPLDSLAEVRDDEARENLLSAECLSGETSLKLEETSENASSSSERHGPTEVARATPLGLGMGSLERKKRIRQPKPLSRNVDTGPTDTAPGKDINTDMTSQQLLQSIASHSSISNRAGMNDTFPGHVHSTNGRATDGRPLGEQGSDGQFNPASVMNQVLDSPALDGLLAGVSEQTGFGSPNVLRDMLQRLSQNHQIMSSVSQIAQQVDSQELGNVFSGLGSGHGGGIDLSRMVQQMMPVVSQVLGQVSATPQPLGGVEPEPQLQHNETGSSGAEEPNDQSIQEVAGKIECLDTPEEVFRAVAENAVRLNQNGNHFQHIVDELSNNEDLVRDYVEMLQHDIGRQLEDNSGHDKC